MFKNIISSLRMKMNRWVSQGHYHISHDNYVFGLLFDVFKKDYYTGGLRFKIPKHLVSRSFRTRFFFDTYEKTDRWLAKKFISPRDTILELGGCIGVVSCQINKVLLNPKKHVVVEANPNLIEKLTENRNINGCQFSIENCLVSNSKKGEFYLHDLIIGGSTLRKEGQKIIVPTMTIKDLENKYQLKFTTLVIDIEGGELAFLQENKSLLKRVNSILLELHSNVLNPDQIGKCQRILKSSGLTNLYSHKTFEAWSRT